MDRLALEQAIRLLAQTAIEHRSRWDELDRANGDGDFGTTLARGFARVLERWDGLDHSTAQALLEGIAEILTGEMGGSSGPLWGVAFRRAGRSLGEAADVGLPELAAMLAAAVDGIREYGGAEVGDKTMLDALVPLAQEVAAADAASSADALQQAAEAAAAGARATRALRARRGRAAYSGERSVGAPDPGAVAVAVIAARLCRAAGADAPATSDLEAQPADVQPGEPPASGSQPTKQFVNDPENLVSESLRGLAAAHPELVDWDEPRGIVRRVRAVRPGQVGLVSGGGSGHEPLHAGFVGPGMLSAAAPGQVFASPSVGQVLSATRSADAGGGVLHVVKSYTGDRMNFRLAADLAAREGIRVASVIVEDDAAIARSTREVGRRGTGATVLVEKLAGACAERGGALDEVETVARRVVSRSASFGVALTSCSSPGGSPILQLAPDEIEVGVGIHGEPGRRRAPLSSAADIVDEIVRVLLDDLRPLAGAPMLTLVSGLGGTPLMQQHLVFAEVTNRLRAAGLAPARSLVGPYLTSLDMAGVLVTLLELDEQLQELWDAPVVTPALRWGA